MDKNFTTMDNDFSSMNDKHLHVQLGGLAFYDDRRFFQFCPDRAETGQVPRFRMSGVAQQLSDGTFAFEGVHRRRSQTTLLRKLAHGRLSATQDGSYLLTIRISKEEGLDVKDVLLREVYEAVEVFRKD